MATTLKFQMEKLVLLLIAVKINEKLRNECHQTEKISKRLFRQELTNTTFSDVEIGIVCGKIAVTYKIEKNGTIY